MTGIKKNINEIFPNLNTSTESGLKIEKGILKEIDYDQYSTYLGDDEDSWYFPGVKGFDHKLNDFNSPGWIIDTFVITTAMKKIDTFVFMMMGFNNFYIVDEKTGSVVFYTNRFISNDDLSFVGMRDLFFEFVREYNADPQGAMNNKKYAPIQED